MVLRFTKMHGLGNDFIVLDATRKPIHLSVDQIRQLANRRRGIGFDQLLVLEPSTSEQADFNYRIFNADGSPAEQCGNGARCIARFIQQHHLSKEPFIRLQTATHIIKLHVEEDDDISVEMGVPYFEPKRIPFITQQDSPPYSIKTTQYGVINFWVVGLGNPHAVIEMNDVKQDPSTALAIGRELSTHTSFPAGVNVGFMHILTPSLLELRVYERGVGETHACGSGACAAAVVGIMQNKLTHEVRVSQTGGDLLIHWRGPDNPVIMKGEAKAVYEGECLWV